MSVRFVVAAAAAAVVGYFGGFQAGAATFSLVYGVTGFLDPNAKVQGPRLDDLKGPTAAEGTAIPYIEGVWRTAGAYVWNSDKHEVATTTTSDGKGGPGVDSTTFTYTMDVLIMFSINQLIGIRRVWSNGKLIWSNADGSDDGSLLASTNTSAWAAIRFYDGNPNQLPDAVYEAAVGIGNAPAYRGRSCVFIEALNLGGSGQLPILNFEVVSSGTVASKLIQQPVYTVTEQPNNALVQGVASYVNPAGHTLFLPQFTNSYENKDFVALNWQGSSFGLTPGGGSFALDPVTGHYDTTLPLDGIADESYWLAQSSSFAKPTFFTVSAGAVPDATKIGVTGYARYQHTTMFFGHDASSGANVISIDGTNNIGTGSHLMQTAALSGGVWYVKSQGNSGSILTFTVDPITGHLIAGTPISDPSAGTNAILLADVGTGELYLHDDSVLFVWDGTTWSQAATSLPPDLQSTNPPYGETIVNGNLSVLRWVYVGSVVPTFTLVTGVLAQSLALVPVALDQLVTRLCERTGLLTAADIDVTSLASDTVRGIALSSGTTRQALELLMPAYSFEATETDKIKFVKRGGAPVMTIAYADLGAAMDTTVEPLPTSRTNDTELPAKVTVTFANALNDYQDGTVSGDRLITDSTSTQATQLALILTPTEAQKIADIQTMDLQVSLDSIGPISVTRSYAALEPTDPVLIEDADGGHFRGRIMKVTDGKGGARTFELLIDDASVVISDASGDTTDNSTVLVRQLLATVQLPLDIPILRDADNDSGFYDLAKPADGVGKWSGAVIYSSPDDVTLTQEDTILERAIFGKCVNQLDDYTGFRQFDEFGSVIVNVGAGALSSSTRAALLGDQTINACAIGVPGRWELMQFRTATLQSAGIYKLSGLLRGSRGTEWATTGHTTQEVFAVLTPAGTRRIHVENTLLGLTRYYRAVSIGKSVASATSQTFIDNGVGLKPFSPFDVRASRDPTSHDITLTWQRRTRLATRTIGPMGISIPLGETVEAYSVDVFTDNTYTTVKRTLVPAMTGLRTLAYTSAQQVADFGSNQATIYVKVYQLSAIVGRGKSVKAAA